MSIEREVNTPSGQTLSQADILANLPPEQLEEELAKILDRGLVASRLAVPLPPDTHGEWVPNDPMEIHRKQSLGFSIDNKYALGNALHSDGTGKPIIGDVIFMTCPMKLKEAFDTIALKKYHENNGKKKKEDKLKEEKEFHNQAASPGYISTDPSVTKVNSSTEIVDANVISAAKAAMLAEKTSGGTE